MVEFRIVAILVGFAITFALQNWPETHWYVSIPAGVIGYLAARYIGWAINQRDAAIERNRESHW